MPQGRVLHCVDQHQGLPRIVVLVPSHESVIGLGGRRIGAGLLSHAMGIDVDVDGSGKSRHTAGYAIVGTATDTCSAKVATNQGVVPCEGNSESAGF